MIHAVVDDGDGRSSNSNRKTLCKYVMINCTSPFHSYSLLLQMSLDTLMYF